MINGVKLCVLINRINNESDNRAAMNDRKTANATLLRFKFVESIRIKSKDNSTLDANIVGMDIIIDRFVLLSREKPSIKAPVIVFPDRDVPGINATDCHSPMKMASL